MNHKKTYRLYREGSLAIRRKKRKRPEVPRTPKPAPERANERWLVESVREAREATEAWLQERSGLTGRWAG